MIHITFPRLPVGKKSDPLAGADDELRNQHLSWVRAGMIGVSPTAESLEQARRLAKETRARWELNRRSQREAK